MWLNQIVENQNPNKEKLINKIKGARLVNIVLGVAVALLIMQYFGVIKAEVTYLFKEKSQEKKVILVDKNSSKEEGTKAEKNANKAKKQESTKQQIIANNNDFALVIPKIGVNMRILPNIDPFDAKTYQKALSQGVAHAVGTSTPSQGKNTVLFAHSTDNFYNANRYNAVFYLLSKLLVGDSIFIVEDGRIYEYAVVSNSVVDAGEMGYMEQNMENVVTLITCWPPGTTLKRRVVIGKMIIN